mmetsp:Transcript_33507/g.105873  ORF Transcript_33507/g.105873 Transcript_33507/m.105873 type:complete len:249 (+) Transcript_33507:731-1477(+)
MRPPRRAVGTVVAAVVRRVLVVVLVRAVRVRDGARVRDRVRGRVRVGAAPHKRPGPRRTRAPRRPLAAPVRAAAHRRRQRYVPERHAAADEGVKAVAGPPRNGEADEEGVPLNRIAGVREPPRDAERYGAGRHIVPRPRRRQDGLHAHTAVAAAGDDARRLDDGHGGGRRRRRAVARPEPAVNFLLAFAQGHADAAAAVGFVGRRRRHVGVRYRKPRKGGDGIGLVRGDLLRDPGFGSLGFGLTSPLP